MTDLPKMCNSDEDHQNQMDEIAQRNKFDS